MILCLCRHLPLFRTLKNDDMRTLKIAKTTSLVVGFLMLLMMAGINVDNLSNVVLWLAAAATLLWFGDAFKKK